MKTFLGFLGFVLFTQGIGGLAYELTDGRFHLWAGLTHKAGFLHGNEIYASIGLIVLGVALFAARESVNRSRPPS
jgi:hypothetical protein